MALQPPAIIIDSKLSDHSLVTIQDQPQPCPYLFDRQARMPLQWPTQPLTAIQVDQFMDAGYRRSGSFLYQTHCEPCFECEPTRVDVRRFLLSRSLRRVLARGDSELRVECHPPSVTSRKLELLNQHRLQRDLALNGVALDESDYRSFLVDTCCPTQEIHYYGADNLLAVAVVDVGQNCLSAVYCYFSPAHSRLSLGTYSILKQIQFAQESGRQYLYLGMHVAANEHLNYKSRFVPQERLVRGIWQAFDEKS